MLGFLYDTSMLRENTKEALILFFGDLFILVGSLWLALLIRYTELPNPILFMEHFVAFSFLYVVWILVFFIAGLYEKHTLLFKSRLPSTIFNVQIINSVIAISFFYLLPFFAITPKTNLFIWLIISFVSLVVWRLQAVPMMGFRKKQNALLIASGDEMKELREEINNNKRYGLSFVSSIDLNKLEGIDFKDEVLDVIYSEEVSTIVVDLRNEKVLTILPHLYNLIYSHVRFVDMYKLYEDIFDRVPLSSVSYNWFIENISSSTHIAYDAIKRGMDIIIALILGTVSLIFYPFVWIAIKIEDRGPIFFRQERVGQGNRTIQILKFRSMKEDDGTVSVEKDSPDRVTKVGALLRVTRIDELPQLWNVLKGDLSLIGPRPEVPALFKIYEKEIPYYNIRHLIKPGLSGWAQIYQQEAPKFETGHDETRTKLSYDLYYIKNRSIILDFKIALKTIKTLMSRTGV